MPRRNPHDPTYGADVLSLAEAGHRLGRHPQTVKKGIQLGVLPGVMWDQTYVIPRKAFELFLLLGRMPRHEDTEVAA